MSYIRSIILLALAASAHVSAGPTRRAEDHLARDAKTLATFAKTVKSDPKKTVENWTGSDPCSFKGVRCDNHPDGYKAVSTIDVNGAKLGDNLSLTGLLDKLTDLVVFHANNNGFTGQIPSVSKLPYLYELDLSTNKLSGKFPTQVLEAPLTFLDLRFNKFTGELPPALFQSTDMDVIFLNDNQFSGSLPEFGNIPTLYITLANNKFTGKIPASISKAKSLKEILLNGNAFTGTVPEELCALPLDVLNVSGNKLDKTLGPKCQKLLDAKVLII